jgi:peptidyl-prolyl cis-trans isomerase D
MFQRRELQVVRFETKNYLAKAEASEAELQAWYDDPKNAARLQSPETVSIEYVVLDLDAVQKSVSVPEDDLRKYYSENAARYTQPEERQARHILVKVEPNASADAKAKARAKIEGLLAELKKNRASFAELAKKNSDDPGSAAQGGDLGWFGRGAMTGPFDDASFKLKKGELSGIIETDFGLHILEVTDARGGAQRSFESVRGEMETEVRKQLAQKRFSELAVQFTDAVDQESGLKPVADKFKLELRQEAALQRQPQPGANPVLANPKLLAELFSNDSLGRKQNLQAIDLGSNQLVSARVLSHSPARKQTLDEVRAKVREAVLNAKAVAAARDDAAARLKQWQADPASAASSLPQPVVVSRGQLQNLPAKLVDAALRAPTSPLPAWFSVDLGDAGQAVVKLNQILPADQIALGGPARIQSQYAQLWSQAESEAYYGALKQRFKAQVSLKAKATAADAAASAASN